MAGKTIGRPTVLDDAKKATICALVSHGCSQRSAAGYVGCAPSTITYALAQDEKFRGALDLARAQHEFSLVEKMRNATGSKKYWKAAAWMLERKFPDEYRPRDVDVVTKEQLNHVLARFAEVLLDGIEDAEQRDRVVQRMLSLASESSSEETPAELPARLEHDDRSV